MLANRHSATVRKSLGPFCEHVTAIKFVPKNLLDGVTAHPAGTQIDGLPNPE